MKISLLLFAALLTGFVPAVQAGDDIHIHDAWVRAAPPGATVLAAYLTIDNHSAQPQVFDGASSPQFDSVEIHRTEVKNGIASMSAQPRVAIAAHGRLNFEPNSYHLMLIGPRQALHADDQIELRLQFDGHAAQTIHAAVRADDAPAAGMMHHHH